MGKLTPSKELRTVYKVLKRIHAAEQLEETDPGMFAPEVFDIDAAQRDRIMAMLQAEGLIDGVIVRKYVGQRRETVLIDWQALEVTLKGLQYLEENRAMRKAAEEAKGIVGAIRPQQHETIPESLRNRHSRARFCGYSPFFGAGVARFGAFREREPCFGATFM